MSSGVPPEQAAAEQTAGWIELTVKVIEQFGGELSRKVLADMASGRIRSVGAARASLAEMEVLLAQMNAEAVPRAAEAITEAFLAGGLTDPGPQDELRLQHLLDVITGRLNDLSLKLQRQIQAEYGLVALRASLSGALVAQRRLQRVAPNVETAAGSTGFIDRAGRIWDLGDYATMLMRTETRSAHTVGVLAHLSSTGQDLVRVSSHDHPEDECTPFDGQVFSISGASDRYPLLDDVPPFHPNCLHVLEPA